MSQTGLTKLNGQVLELLLSVDELMWVHIVGVLQSKATIYIIEHGLGLSDAVGCMTFVLACVDADW